MKWLKRLGWTLLTLFVLLNMMAAFHAWKFTHYTDTTAPRTDPAKLGIAGKLKTIVFGVDNPRPVNRRKPSAPFETIYLQGSERIECWMIRQPRPKGTVAMFHGYSGVKSSLLERAEIFLAQGYNVMLADFKGSGGSGGNSTTVGYREAEDVRAVYDYLVREKEGPIVLFGTSQGAAAVLKAMHDNPLQPAGLILECPFSTLYQAVCARMHAVGMPGFPLADLVVFWGSIENGFWGFSHQPREFARSVKAPVLLFYGEKDERVERFEIDAVYRNLNGPKKLVTFPQAGHVNFLRNYTTEWRNATDAFLSGLETQKSR
ncbi:alpha/beta hydrolase [Chitinophaga lutea]